MANNNLMRTATSLWHSCGRYRRIEMGESGKVSELEYKTVTSTLTKMLLLFSEGQFKKLFNHPAQKYYSDWVFLVCFGRVHHIKQGQIMILTILWGSA